MHDGHSRFHWLHSRLDGSTFHADVSLSLTTIDGTTRILSQWRDISDTVELSNQFQKNQLFSDSILNTSKAIIATIQPDGVMNYINEYGESFTGYTNKQISAKPYFLFEHFIPGTIQPDIKQLFDAMIQQNQRLTT